MKGQNNPAYKHGMTNKHKLYATWQNMKSRCYNKNNNAYKNYGKRGIIVCSEWKNNFMKFYNWAINNGWNENLTIDRKNNDKGYSISNCRFVNRIIQGRNQRKRKNSKSGFKGVTFNKERRQWRSRITVNKKTIFLGYFYNPLNAHNKREQYIINNNLKYFI